jgi:hypothetical protein
MILLKTFCFTLLLCFFKYDVAHSSISWTDNWHQAKHLASQQNKLIVVYINSDWFIPCQQVEQGILNSPAIATVLSNHFICCKQQSVIDNVFTKNDPIQSVAPRLLIYDPNGQRLGVYRNDFEVPILLDYLTTFSVYLKQSKEALHEAKKQYLRKKENNFYELHRYIQTLQNHQIDVSSNLSHSYASLLPPDSLHSKTCLRLITKCFFEINHPAYEWLLKHYQSKPLTGDIIVDLRVVDILKGQFLRSLQFSTAPFEKPLTKNTLRTNHQRIKQLSPSFYWVSDQLFEKSLMPSPSDNYFLTNLSKEDIKEGGRLTKEQIHNLDTIHNDIFLQSFCSAYGDTASQAGNWQILKKYFTNGPSRQLSNELTQMAQLIFNQDRLNYSRNNDALSDALSYVRLATIIHASYTSLLLEAQLLRRMQQIELAQVCYQKALDLAQTQAKTTQEINQLINDWTKNK